MELNQKIKYDEGYISYVDNGDSAAVFIIRDIVNSINTTGMWIDILSASGDKNEHGQWDFSSISVELFPKKKKAIYPEDANKKVKKYITWETANEDINMQREKGYRGKKYLVSLKLVNENKGKTRTVEKIWNRKFQRYVREEWERTSDCVVRKKKIPATPIWKYKIISVKKMG